VLLLLDTLAEFEEYINDELKEARKLRKELLISDVVSQSQDGPLQWVDIVLAGGCCVTAAASDVHAMYM
jgi:hypothetical protein